MNSTATNNPFSGFLIHHKTIGKGKKKHFEVSMTIPKNQHWKDPSFSTITGIGKTLDAAMLDYAKKTSIKMEELGLVASTSSATYTIKPTNSCTSNTSFKISL